MKGQILDYSVQTNSGVISATDGCRYTFLGSEWKGDSHPARGQSVDFDINGSSAIAIYKVSGASSSGVNPGQKSKITAGILALLLGGLGAHKFYLGYVGQGLVILLINTVGLAITWMLLFTPNIALAVIAVVEGILYLTKTDE